MAVFVDEVRPILPTASSVGNCREACRLWAHRPDELDALAGKLGLRKDWKQGDHYLLTRSKRREALRLGASSASSGKFVRTRNRTRAVRR
jgi:hypothetical protein